MTLFKGVDRNRYTYFRSKSLAAELFQRGFGYSSSTLPGKCLLNEFKTVPISSEKDVCLKRYSVGAQVETPAPTTLRPLSVTTRVILPAAVTW